MLSKKEHGKIIYWVSRDVDNGAPWLVFLPGLTADHRLFDKQVEHFESKANLLVWDAPSHGESRPFPLTWTLDDKARWLKEILDAEGITAPALVGQSMGGYVAQAFMVLFPGVASGFVSIDSCPLQRSYYARWELASLKHTKLMYLSIPWSLLMKVGSEGCATSEYGQRLMREMMESYTKREYCELAAHGYRALALAVEANRPYEVDCPALLICGTKDAAGSAKRYNREWEKRTGIEVHWVEGAGHNSNTDRPDEVNKLIEAFLFGLQPNPIRNSSATIRPIEGREVPLLEDFLYEAIYIPEGYTEEIPRNIIFNDPLLCTSIEGFGTKPDDRCLVAEISGKVVGACWTRITNECGHTDDETPSFAISIYKDYRGKGIGTALMAEMLDLLRDEGFARASLSVQKENLPAIHVYEKVGFEIVGDGFDESEWLMICDLVS